MQGRKGKRVKCIASDDNQPIPQFQRGREGGVFEKPRMAQNHFFCSVLRRAGRQGEARGGQVSVRGRDDLPEERGETDMSMPCLCHASPKLPAGLLINASFSIAIFACTTVGLERKLVLELSSPCIARHILLHFSVEPCRSETCSTACSLGGHSYVGTG